MNKPAAAAPLHSTPYKRQAKDAILAEAAKLFGERGYDGATLDEIATRSQTTRSLILYHFGTKDGVWTHAVERIAEHFHARFARRLARITATTDPERLRAMIAISIDVMSEVPEYGQILVREGTRAGPRLDWLVRCFSPPVMRFDDPAMTGRIRFTLLRDVVIGSILTITTLGPLMEASLSASTGRKWPGLRPLSARNRRDFVDLLAGMIGREVDARAGDGGQGSWAAEQHEPWGAPLPPYDGEELVMSGEKKSDVGDPQPDSGRSEEDERSMPLPHEKGDENAQPQ